MKVNCGVVTIFFICCVFFSTDLHVYENDLEKLQSKNNQIVPWGQKLVGVDYSTGKDVKVAVLDSGINDNHEDLKGKVVKKFNAIHPSEKVKDDFGHGTAVAGIISGNHNDIGIVGITQSVSIYDVKVLDEKGKGTIDSLIRGIQWSIDEGVDIINISLGVENDSEELHAVIKKAISSDIIIVAAAGNTYGLYVQYPAKYEGVLSISSIDENLHSTYSATSGKIDFVAPGQNILSTSSNGEYQLFEGTSFATPFITGFTASILSHSSSKVSIDNVLQSLKKHFNFAETNMNHKGRE
ncbi:S8 family serine peptidase [Bacillus sp. RO2]|uniref:S8 family peptidase n=1 Tax=Bacillus sp. RO2 TaxID=2723913 RepID=UPI00145D8AD5|nr:S8 family serine peptidase [Bacillus sp. RO2]NMH73613.1 S8 family serine peptidase [Bacillus sp. RO2]